MTIPCTTCQRKNECVRDKRCNRPTTVDHALVELKAASEALNAAALRFGEAAAGLQAAWAIERTRA